MSVLDQLINDLYQVFAHYAKPADFPACECCLSDSEKTSLLSTSLRELDYYQLSEYSSDAFSTVGSLPDFKYFLPRILELAIKEKFDWPNPEIVLRKLSLAEWQDWPAEEQRIISKLLKAKFDNLLNDPNSDGHDLDRWICALGNCLLDPTPFLEPLLQPGHRNKLLGLIERNGTLFTENKLRNPFWEDVPEAEKRVIEWLNQPAIRSVLSEQYGMVF